MPILEPKAVESLWQQIEQMTKSGVTCGVSKPTLKAIGTAALPNVPARYRGRVDPVRLGAAIVRAEVDRAAGVKTAGARQRLDRFTAGLPATSDVALARLRKFRLDSALTERGL